MIQEPKDTILLKVDKSRAARKWITDRKSLELARLRSVFIFQDKWVIAINHLLTSAREKKRKKHKYIKEGIIKSNNFSDTEEIQITVSDNLLT